MESSEVFESVLWGLLLIGVGAILLSILSKKNSNSFLMVIGIGALMVGLMCLSPLLNYILAGFKFIILLLAVLTITVTAWQYLTKTKNVETNNIVQQNSNNQSPKPSKETQLQEIIPEGIDKNKKQFETYYDDYGQPYFYDGKWRRMFIDRDLEEDEIYLSYYDELGNKIRDRKVKKK